MSIETDLLKSLLVATDDIKRQTLAKDDSLHRILIDNDHFLYELSPFLPVETLLFSCASRREPRLTTYITSHPEKFIFLADTMMRNKAAYRREVYYAIIRTKK